jgi:hypothetical protein
MNLDSTLAERGARYGDFTDHARPAQALQNVMRQEAGWARLSDVQKQALTVIADKIARILSGDPNYADSWHDIQGYAKLVEERLPWMGVDLSSSQDVTAIYKKSPVVWVKPKPNQMYPGALIRGVYSKLTGRIVSFNRDAKTMVVEWDKGSMGIVEVDDVEMATNPLP